MTCKPLSVVVICGLTSGGLDFDSVWIVRMLSFCLFVRIFLKRIMSSDLQLLQVQPVAMEKDITLNWIHSAVNGNAVDNGKLITWPRWHHWNEMESESFKHFIAQPCPKGKKMWISITLHVRIVYEVQQNFPTAALYEKQNSPSQSVFGCQGCLFHSKNQRWWPRYPHASYSSILPAMLVGWR